MNLYCPKCGVVRGGGSECARCGVIFERYRWVPVSGQPSLHMACRSRGRLSRIARRFSSSRWVLLAVTVILLGLIAKESGRPHIYMDDSAAQRAQWKLQKLQLASEDASSSSVEFDEAEVNAWLRSRMRADKPEASSGIRDIKVKLLDDLLRAYVLIDFHGVNLSLMLEGQARIEDGRLRFDPETGKLGSLPVPQGTFRGIVRRFFDEPATQNRFFIAHRISHLRVDRGALIVTAH
jgi:hypothetical protein